MCVCVCLCVWDPGLYTKNLEYEGAKKNLHTEKIAFNVVQIKFLAMHINNQKLSLDTFTVGHLQNIFMEHDLYLIS